MSLVDDETMRFQRKLIVDIIKQTQGDICWNLQKILTLYASFIRFHYWKLFTVLTKISLYWLNTQQYEFFEVIYVKLFSIYL